MINPVVRTCCDMVDLIRAKNAESIWAWLFSRLAVGRRDENASGGEREGGETGKPAKVYARDIGFVVRQERRWGETRRPANVGSQCSSRRHPRGTAGGLLLVAPVSGDRRRTMCIGRVAAVGPRRRFKLGWTNVCLVRP